MEYKLKRSRRKTLSIEVSRELEILVRAPMRLSRVEIDRFVIAHRDWAEAHLEKQMRYNAANPEPDEFEIQALKKAALEILPKRVEHFAAIMGFEPSGYYHYLGPDALWKL